MDSLDGMTSRQRSRLFVQAVVVEHWRRGQEKISGCFYPLPNEDLRSGTIADYGRRELEGFLKSGENYCKLCEEVVYTPWVAHTETDTHRIIERAIVGICKLQRLISLVREKKNESAVKGWKTPV